MEVSKTISLTELETATDSAWENNKVPFFFDTQGNASVFFKYKAQLLELHELQVAITAGERTLEDVKEKIRSSLMYAMKSGDTLVFFMDKLMGKFGDYYDEKFLPKEIFNPSEIKNPDIYKKILKEEEDVDAFGNKGGFEMRDTFKVVVLSTRNPEDEDNSDISDNLDTERFEFIKIE